MGGHLPALRWYRNRSRDLCCALHGAPPSPARRHEQEALVRDPLAALPPQMPPLGAAFCPLPPTASRSHFLLRGSLGFGALGYCFALGQAPVPSVCELISKPTLLVLQSSRKQNLDRLSNRQKQFRSCANGPGCRRESQLLWLEVLDRRAVCGQGGARSSLHGMAVRQSNSEDPAGSKIWSLNTGLSWMSPQPRGHSGRSYS